ncbi:uncharacterized protein LOC126678548 [Mercurialis annua]|uniref:uncharacterized protein LOC126678548 n=1 Tax=Mercurialis annua TaxID=3986 RepID=UPI0024AF0B62|nr:uncharacterized protein LOC126678548 [Mercurialis annua]
MRESNLRFLSLVLISCYFTELTSSTVVLNHFFSFPDLPAKSAVGVNKSGICGALHVANPVDACSPILNRFELNGTKGGRIRFGLVDRGECSFEDKIRNIQDGGFSAAIVFDDRDKRNLVYMMMNPKGIKVHAVFVSKVAGEILKEHARGEEGECCIYSSHNDTAWTVLAISFLSLLFIVAFLMIAFTLSRHWLFLQRTNSRCKTVDVRLLEGFPRFTFHSAQLNRCHSGETCAICLEDYKDGEILKVLPCQHEFHSGCVDSWLTKWGTFCPICKFDIKTVLLQESKPLDYHGCSIKLHFKFAVDLNWTMRNYCLFGSCRLNHVYSLIFAGSIQIYHFSPTRYRFCVWLLPKCQYCIRKMMSTEEFQQNEYINCSKQSVQFPLLPQYSLVEDEQAEVRLGAEVVTVDVKAAKDLLQSGYVYLDVRTTEEFMKGHVHSEKILNIPYMFNTPEGRVKNPKFLQEVSAVCKLDDHIVVGCQSGVRSLYATADMLSAGFKDASNMGGGYLAWIQNKFPLKIEEPQEQKNEL